MLDACSARVTCSADLAGMAAAGWSACAGFLLARYRSIFFACCLAVSMIFTGCW